MEENKMGAVIWIFFAVAAVVGMLCVKHFMLSNSAPRAVTVEYSGHEEAAPDESTEGESVPQSDAETKSSLTVPLAAPASTEEAGTETAAAGIKELGSPKTSRHFGLKRGAILAAVGGLMKNPGAVAAILNNKYVVGGFMARDTVKSATANSRALAAYLKNPDNISGFMGNPSVRAGMNNSQMVDAVASSKLVSAMLDTPGGRGLLNDPSAIADVLAANPSLLSVLTNPNILAALMNNPATAGVVGNITGRSLK